MKKSAELNVELMKVNNEIGDLAGEELKLAEIEDDAKRADALTEQSNKFSAFNLRRKELATRYEAALVAEEADLAQDVPADAKPKQVQEFLKLRETFNLKHAASSAAGDRVLQGAEAQFAEACLGSAQGPQGGVAIPMEFFDNGPETLADVEKFALTLADGARTVIQNPVMERVYADTVSDFLGVVPLAAGAGVQSWATFATGGTASALDRDAADAESATSITVAQVTPKALSMRYRLNVEDNLVLGNNEALHVSDITRAMQDAYDTYNLGSEGFGAIVDIAAPAAVTPHWTGTGNISTLNSAYADGVYATSREDVRLVFSMEAWRYAASGYFPGATPTVPVSALDYLQNRSQIRATSRIAEDATTHTSQCLYARDRHEHAIAPMWAGIELIRDIYTGADRRRVWLTAVSYVGFLIRRASVYGKFAVRSEV